MANNTEDLEARFVFRNLHDVLEHHQALYEKAVTHLYNLERSFADVVHAETPVETAERVIAQLSGRKDETDGTKRS